MHELGIATDLLEIALAEARKHGGNRITAVNLQVGVLRGVVPEHLHFLFGHVAKGTIAEAARLEIEEEPIRVECEACGPSEAREFTLECPACKKPCARIEGGDALRILSLEIDD
ncbi:MAG: hydrogenase maturation nickel metallochaperone HypA [Candidatus Deferrimicrobiaceae bacterium]